MILFLLQSRVSMFLKTCREAANEMVSGTTHHLELSADVESGVSVLSAP
jgi:hypothetical protein